MGDDDAVKLIRIRGARTHNLRNISLDLPRDRLIVVTGLSGSGKSSLAFDTIYAEGQRKYVESLSAYARQFLGQMVKPDVDQISGLPPTIAIAQQSGRSNPRSTVATTTEIYDYLRLLFARVGTPHCPKCGRRVHQQTVTQMVNAVLELPEGSRTMIMAPLVRGQKGEHKEVFKRVLREGFVRMRVDGEVCEVKHRPKLDKKRKHTIEAVVDRIIIKPDLRTRLSDSIETALKMSDGLVVVSHQAAATSKGARRGLGGGDSSEPGGPPPGSRVGDDPAHKDDPPCGWCDAIYSQRYACTKCGISLPELEPRVFSFNSPHGACPACDGLGTVMQFDPDLVVPDPTLALEQGAIDAWRAGGRNMSGVYARLLREFCARFGVSPATPYQSVPQRLRQILMWGTTPDDESEFQCHFEGAIPNLDRRWNSTGSESVKTRLHGYLSERPCKACGGARLRPESLAVKIAGANIDDVVRMSIDAAAGWHGQAEEEGTEGSRDQGTKKEGPGDQGTGGRRNAKTPKRQNAQVEKSQKVKKSKSQEAWGIVQDSGLSTQHSGLSTQDSALSTSSSALSPEQARIAEPILGEIRQRLGFMIDVGIGYLTLNRRSATLSGGESQRIRLATQVGSGLVGVCYVLDEPTIGLHQRDSAKLIDTLRRLTALGNTVIVVEHDAETIAAAEWIVDIGPEAGAHGGRVLVNGTRDSLMKSGESITAKYLRGELGIDLPAKRRPISARQAIEIKAAAENNLKSIDVRFPLGVFCCVTGVSGSGKSSLVNQILLPALRRRLYDAHDRPGAHERILGIGGIEKVIEIDQSPIGRTPRSNPATYAGLFDLIRQLYAKTREAKIRGYSAGRFSFNVKGGRCEACQGQGTKRIEMHFLPDIFVECGECKGTRYGRETLEVRYRGKSIADVLAMRAEEALAFFDSFNNIKQILRAMCDVGLSYLALGQSSTTLSGGEAQRVKLAAELGKPAAFPIPHAAGCPAPSGGGGWRGGQTLYVLDEPTTGLHFADIHKLLEVLNRLCNLGHSIIVIEHNMDVIKQADWIIDLGPEGGDAGGRIVAEGTPEQIAADKHSHTGKYLRKVLGR